MFDQSMCGYHTYLDVNLFFMQQIFYGSTYEIGFRGMSYFIDQKKEITPNKEGKGDVKVSEDINLTPYTT